MKNIVILGSTGSIGQNTLDVIRSHPDKFRVLALVAGNNVALLQKQAEEFRPKMAVAKSDGMEAAVEAATLPEADIVVSAIVGAAGLRPTYAALKAGKRVALANKESLVAAGAVMTKVCEEGGGELLPVDSEHSAIHQVLHGKKEAVLRIILTASGGPFRTWPIEKLSKATVEDALKHPNWKMGNKITVDSATMMNKGLEIIEAHWLFGLPPEKIAVTVHPQSVVHSLVEYIDGSVLAQMGLPDMRTPIAYALAYPERITAPVSSLDLAAASPLTFEAPDPERFPSLKLAQEVLRKGKSFPAVLNAANEVAVEAFLKGKIGFMDIAKTVETVLGSHQPVALNTLDDVLETDRRAREKSNQVLGTRY
ncbi:MAG: 1-deoxy-D-xylulose-5-phosphate reductoisomerase [Deltaproteobacteria bacterium]|nr:1-deoxy-D-xylulose-5-phosphate reductoisomerase [Deltaproteobacteria bacterium]